MAQPTDIVINSAGYMIEPGTASNPGYRRLQDGMAEGRTQRTTFTDFFGGGNRAFQLERDTFGKSLNVGPVLGGQGVQPWALEAARADMADLNPVGGTPVRYQVIKDRIYFAIGKTLYFRTYGSGASGTVVVKSYSVTITDLTVYSYDGLLICFGSASPMIFRSAAGVETGFFSGEYANFVQAYGGKAIWSDARPASIPTNIRMATGSSIQWRYLDYEPTAITVVDGELLIITKQALYRFTGRVKDVMIPNPAYTGGGTQPPQIPGEEWSGEFEPYFQQGIHTERDDFRFVLGYGGRTVAWIAGGVHEQIPTGDRAGWRSTGLHGLQCYGACVAAGYLVVAMLSEAYKMELWAWDGNSWWRFGLADYAPTGNWCNPIPIGGGSNDHDITIFHHNTARVTTYRLAPRSGGATAMAVNSAFVTPLIDAGERDKPKAWRKLGAIFAAPETYGPTSSDSVAVYLDYSINAGHTWTQVASQSVTANIMPQINFDLEAALSGVVSRFIVLRVRWVSVADYAPILTGIWVEHEVLQNPARRRKWALRIHARDQEIDRDGSVFTRTGRQLIAELWAAWETDTTLTFRDIDYDAAPTQRTVRIVGIAEANVSPSDSAEWGDSIITLNLVEV